ncbi:MAG: phosphomannomutase/phosphoglucomutase [Gammaproteobacteria bacterium]
MLADTKQLLDPGIFRAYDIRGIVDESLTPETVFLIGKGLGSLALDAGRNEIAIARDGRLSGPALSAALCDGILSTGCHVVDLGVAPTPVLYYATHQLPEQSGVMLTGSHNPPNYNGLKSVINGKTLAEDAIQGLYQRIIENRLHQGQGVKRELNIIEAYIADVVSKVKLSRRLKVVIDAGNGVTGMMAPALFKALGCDVHEIFCDVDGTFPNHHADPSQPENLDDLIHAVKETKADIGLAFDGDGDRLGVVTSHGSIIWPDRLLMLFAQALLAEEPNAHIIYDVKCSNHLADHIKSYGGQPLMWKTGHSLIKAKMIEMKAALAGEMSGHFFFKHRWYGFDDALYAGARLLEILANSTEDSEVIFAAIPNSVNTPELKVLVPEADKFAVMQQLIDGANFADAKEIITIDGLRVNFVEGWGLVRPSNTTPYLVLRFEAVSTAMLDNIQALFRAWILSIRPELKLPF